LARPAAAALAWVQSRPDVASTTIGARRLDQLKANLAALDLGLTDAQIARLNAVSKPVLNFPGEINTHLAPPVGFPGATEDGQTWPLSP
jgi:diketogulonate reductase-like aldo/keto reductase